MRLAGKLATKFLLLVFCACVSRLALAQAEQKDIDSLVEDAAHAVMSQYKVDGLAIATTVGGKQRFYNYGVASRETQQRVSSDTLFEIGSISKTITATLATYAQVTGKLLLTDSVGMYLPELKGSQFDRVTLINLATHTAGGFPLQFPEYIKNTEQMMAYFKGWQPTFAPGTHRTYANPSVGMLGLIAAKSMNMPFETALEQSLFPELGMPDSFINVPSRKMSLYAQGYDKKDNPVRLNLGILGAEAYGVKTSSKDLIHFIEANMGLAQTSPALERALAATHTGYFELGPMTQDLIWEQYQYPVTLNALLGGNSDKLAYESNAVTTLSPPRLPQQLVWINKTGSTNGFGAYVAFVPAKHIGIVILANKNFPNEARVRLAHRILTELGAVKP